MKFQNAVDRFGWKTRNVNLDSEIGLPCIDSRKILNGDVFWAMKGERDGGEFAESALEKGAQVAIVVEEWAEKLKSDAPVIIVEDVLQALTDLAGLKRDEFKGQVIAITGSCGKTTIKDLLTLVLSKKYRVLKSPASYNNHIGVPFTLCSLKDEHEIAVVEIGANHPGEIAELSKIAKPDAGLITMIGDAHLEGFGDIIGVAKAKGELFRELYGEKIAFVNFDDPNVIRQSEVVENKIGFGFSEPPSYIEFKKIYSGKIEKGFGFSVDGQEIEFPFPEYLAIHALAAAAVGLHYNVPIDQIADAVCKFKGVKGRMQKVEVQGIRLYDDTYNSNPSSLKAALEYIAGLPGGKKIAVLGDMLELGDYSLREHQKVLLYAKNIDFHTVLTMGENFSAASSENNFTDDASLIEALQKITEKGDIILFKGSRMMQMERILEKFQYKLKG